MTDSDGRLSVSPFPPGPTEVSVEMFNSTYIKRVTVPENGAEIAMQIPDGLIPVKVIDAETRKPLAAAKVVWTGSGARVEASANANGDALLEGAGTAGGTLTISASLHQTLEGSFTELPETMQEVTLTPLRPTRMVITITNEDGDPLPGAIVQLESGRVEDPLEFAVTASNGVAPIFEFPPGALRMTVYADGYVTGRARIAGENGGGVGLVLQRAK